MKYMEDRCMESLSEAPCRRRAGQLMALEAHTSGDTWTQPTGKFNVVNVVSALQASAFPLAMFAAS